MKLFPVIITTLLFITTTFLWLSPAIATQDTAVSLIERYQRALSIDSNNPTLQYQLGVALLVENKPYEAIKKLKDSWNREEVEELCRKALNHEGYNTEFGRRIDNDNWIENNLKKY